MVLRRVVQPSRLASAAADVVSDEIDEADARPACHAEDGPCGGEGGGHALLHQKPGQGQADDKLAQGLDDLGHGGGHHVGVPLGIPPEGGEDAHEETGGRDGLDGVNRHAVSLQIG